jgi:hypothetical protein
MFHREASGRRKEAFPTARDNDLHRSTDMAHHKRRRPKNRRAGCLLCKPWKINGFARARLDGERFSDHRRRVVAAAAVRELDR